MRVGAVIGCGAVVAGLVAGCGEDGYSKAELKEAKQAAYERGQDNGYADGLEAGRDESADKVIDARNEGRRNGFEQGVAYSMSYKSFEPGTSYAVSFEEGPRGDRVKEWLRMRTGESYECPPYDDTCIVTDATGTGVGDNCDPSYDPCVPAYPPDVDCPEIYGPVTVIGPDVHGLDADTDGTGCE